MAKKITILVCDKFKDETMALQKVKGSHAFEVASFPARCGCPEISWDELAKLFPPGRPSAQIHILGSCCIAQLNQTPAPLPNCTLHHRLLCFYLFSSASHIDSLLANGSYLATPGWLRQWPRHLEKLGFTHADEARDFFKQSAKNITLLDTLIFEDNISQANEFADFVGLPLERIPVGLDYFQLVVNQIIAANELKSSLAENTSLKQKAADCMMSMDILAGLSSLHDEEKIIAAVLELFTILFSPQEIKFFRSDSNPDNPILLEKTVKDKFALIEPDKRGFWLLLEADTFSIGIIKVNEIAFPEYIPLYVNLALPIARLCVLMIGNSRTEKALRNAQKMETIGTMAGGIAHHFNNILGAVLGFIELALEEIPPENQSHHYLLKALKGANRAKDLVAQIKVFSQQKVSDSGLCSPAVLLPELIAALSKQLPAAIIIEQHLPTDIGRISMDGRVFEMIFQKLWANSIDAMEESGGVLSINLEKIELSGDDLPGDGTISPGQFIKMTITDTGHGIPAENLSRIFDPFFTTKDIGKGDGIGLSIVKGLLNNIGGKIEVESKIGKGSTFTVYLPADKEVQVDD